MIDASGVIMARQVTDPCSLGNHSKRAVARTVRTIARLRYMFTGSGLWICWSDVIQCNPQLQGERCQLVGTIVFWRLS